jgi:RNA polymerase sigma-70 factor (ECF subfamily)
LQDARAQSPGELTDERLVHAVASGDRAAFEVLFDRYEKRLFRYARGLVRTEAEAEDVLQETFLAIWRHLSVPGAADELSSVRGWLYAICRNSAYRRGRRRSGEPSAFEGKTTLDRLGAAAGWGTDEDPEQLSARLQSRQAVREALMSLPDEDRDVLWLRDIAELTGDEAADVLGVSVAAMKSRLHRARLKLLAVLRQPHGGTS